MKHRGDRTVAVAPAEDGSAGPAKEALEIEGMHCASCVTAVERALKRLPGVREASVNLATERATVEYDPKLVGIDEFKRVVGEIGYEVTGASRRASRKRTLEVEGMHCASCVNAVERALEELSGVRQASVNLAAGRATVEYDPSQVDPEEFRRAVEAVGYQVMGALFDDAQDRRVREREKLQRDQLKVVDAKRRMFQSWVLTLPIMIWMVPEMVFARKWPSDIVFDLGIIFLAAPVVLIWGWPTLSSGYRSLLRRTPTMDTLIALGASVAFITGFVTVGHDLGVLPKLLNYSGVAAMIMAFHLTGRYVETKARGRTSQAIQKLLSLEVKTAQVERDGKEIEVALEDIVVGDVMIVRPGEKIPTDGEVVDGRSMVDESLATGESMPVLKRLGDPLIGSTINKDGALKVRATGVGEDTFLAHVIRMVEEAQGTKVPIQEFAERVTAVFVPAVLGLAALTLVAWIAFPSSFHGIAVWASGFLPWVDPDLGPISLAIFAAVAVLVIACPCALGLATPTALMVGTGIGASNGILIRSGEAIQTLREVDTIVMDKTGTITRGEPGVTDVVRAAGWDEEVLLSHAAGAESGSEHPLGEAIVAHARERGIELEAATDFEAVSGLGIRARVGGHPIVVGNTRLMEESNVDVSALSGAIERLENEAKTAAFVAVDGRVAGVIAVADRLKAESKSAIAALEGMGLETVMLTGDNESTARAIARDVGIDRVIARVLPGDKVEQIRRLQADGRIVAMVGDGINDAAALKQANVGIAIGTGTDVAIEAGDIILVGGELSGVVRAIQLSVATFRKIRQNLFWAYFYNVIAIPLAMMGFLHPAIAEGAMAFSSVTVVGNSNSLRKIDLRVP